MEANTRVTKLLNPQDCLLIVIDVQKKLTPLIGAIPDVIPKILKLIRLARLVEVPVLSTEQENLGDIVDEVGFELADVPPVRKLSFSCFGEDNFTRRLASHDRRTLILTGIEAHICVAQTALSAPSGFRSVVVADATASRSDFDKETALDRLKENGVTITSTDMLMYELLQKAGTDVFRAALPLLK
jgi:nicotinamidase-related amidase